MIGFDDDDCPCSLVFDYERQACVFPCIPFDQPQSHVVTMYTMVIVFGWLSFLCGWFYCITALFRRELLRFPLSNTFTLQLALTVGAVGFIVEGNLGMPYSCCENDVTPADGSHWPCGLVAALTLFSAMCGIHAWTAFNISVLLKLAKVPQKGREWATWVVAAWTVAPFAISIPVLFATDRIGYGPSAFSCTAIYDIDQTTKDAIIWTFWLGPILFWLGFNVLLVAGILFYIVKTAMGAGMSLWRLFKKQIRLLLFYAWFLSAMALTAVNLLYSMTRVDTFVDNVESYLLCVNTQMLYGEILPDDNDCSVCDKESMRNPFGLVVAQLVVFSSLGFVCFLLLGFRRDIFAWWIEYFKMAWSKKELLVVYEMEESRNVTVKSHSISDSGTLAISGASKLDIRRASQL